MNVKELRESAGLTQSELSAKTGIPRDRIAKWEQGKGKPKADDEKKLLSVFGKFRENVPQETQEIQIAQSEKKPITAADMQAELKKSGNQSLDFLIESNRSLSEANKSLARSHEALVAMLQKATGGAPIDSGLSVTSILPGLLEVLAILGTGEVNQWHSKEEGVRELYRKLNLIEPAKDSLADIHSDGGK